MAKRPNKRKGKPPLAKRLKKRMNKAMIASVNRIDFLGLLDKINNSRIGQEATAHLGSIPNSWPDLEGLKAKAVELAMNQLTSEGDQPDLEEIRSIIEKTSCRYDHGLHQKAGNAVVTLMKVLFEHDQPELPFTSKDQRDLKHVDQLKNLQDQGLGVVYLINHSAHLDEFLMACQTVHSGSPLPLFAAGANMFAIESLSKILILGSYVVQRRGASRHNLAGLFNFCRAISETGGQQAIFLEAWHGGARSRDGSLRYPRRLVTLRGALEGETDRVVQPVAISYSAVPEDLSLAARKGGLCWLSGMGFFSTLGQMIMHPRSFWLRIPKNLYGRAYLTLSEPLLLSELKKEHEKDDQGGLGLDEFVALKAIKEIARCKKVMASQLSARALVRARREKSGDLAAAYQTELNLLREYHQSTFGQEPDLEDFISENSVDQVLADGLATLKRRKVLARFKRDENKLPKVLNLAGLSFYATHGDRRIYSPTADQNIVVVGAGDWGFALTHLVGNRILEEKRYLNASLTLFDPRPEVAQEMGITRHPAGRFEEYRLPKNAFVTSDPTSAFRKASEIILISPTESLEQDIGLILETSAQPLKLIVATCGFVSGSNRLPCQVALDLVKKTGRHDVDVYALAGPASEAELVEGRSAYAVLAGPQAHLKDLADLFNWPPAMVETAQDPLGVQAATICGRIYALWVHYLTRSGQVKGASQVGQYTAQAAKEATKLGLALGGDPETYMAGSPAWTGTYTAEGLSKHSREFGAKLAALAKRKGLSPEGVQDIHQQMQGEGVKVSAYQDLQCAHLAAKDHGLELPILAEAYEAIWGE